MADDATRAEGEFKRGWPVVFSAAIGIGLGLSPLPFYTIGVFVGPLSQPIEAGGLGLSPAQIMLCACAQFLCNDGDAWQLLAPRVSDARTHV
jgi:hypothetical protein